MSQLPSFPLTGGGQPPTGYSAYPRHAGMDDGNPPGSKTMAIWALVLSIVPIPLAWIAAVVLAILVLSRSKNTRDVGKGMAISALVIVALWVVGIVLLVALAAGGTAHRDSSGVVSSSGDVEWSKLVPGDCVVNKPSPRPKITFEVAPCDEPHMQEVFAYFNLPDGDYPGDKEISRLSEGGCVKRYSGYMGSSPAAADPALKVFFLHPLKSSWHLTKRVVCLLGTGSSSIGTLKDSATSSS
jgi:putative regulator of septum formation